MAQAVTAFNEAGWRRCGRISVTIAVICRLLRRAYVRRSHAASR
jgi:hypothetical protein